MKKLLILLASIAVLFAPNAAGAQTLDSIADELALTGQYIDTGETDPTTEAAIKEANAAGTAFILLNQQDGDAEAKALLDGLLSRLNAQNSRFQSIVLYEPGQGAWAVSNSGDPAAAIQNAITAFGNGDVATGLKQFTNSMAGISSGATTATTAATGTESGAATTTTGSSGGFPWMTMFIIGGLVWFGFRMFNGSKNKKTAKALVETDRKEIKEQLKNNADRVITLGDKAIARGDRELIRLYEEASGSYQDVSQQIDGAQTAEQIDALDDKIDTAEWQFEVIEARLEGRKEPAKPTQPTFPPPPTRADRRLNPADKPQSRNEQAQLEQRRELERQQHQQRQAEDRYSRRPQRTRRRSGGLGGMLGGGMMGGGRRRGGIGSVLLSLGLQFILGGGLSRSRRSFGRATSGGMRMPSGRGGGAIKGPRGF